MTVDNDFDDPQERFLLILRVGLCTKLDNGFKGLPFAWTWTGITRPILVDPDNLQFEHVVRDLDVWWYLTGGKLLR